MNVELVVARYCEDLSWLERMPSDWKVTIYDKSQGGPRERLILPQGYSSPDGPNEAPIWPGAIPMQNVGCGDQSYLYHIVHNYSQLADRTVFLQGDPDFHCSTWFEETKRSLHQDYMPYGGVWVCDHFGRPHFSDGLPELKQMFEIFWPGEMMPRQLSWHGWSMFMASANAIQKIPYSTWQRAEDACRTKLHSCALERLYDRIFGVN